MSKQLSVFNLVLMSVALLALILQSYMLYLCKTEIAKQKQINFDLQDQVNMHRFFIRNFDDRLMKLEAQ